MQAINHINIYSSLEKNRDMTKFEVEKGITNQRDYKWRQWSKALLKV